MLRAYGRTGEFMKNLPKEPLIIERLHKQAFLSYMQALKVQSLKMYLKMTLGSFQVTCTSLKQYFFMNNFIEQGHIKCGKNESTFIRFIRLQKIDIEIIYIRYIY